MGFIMEGTALEGCIIEKRVMDEVVLMIALACTGPAEACWLSSIVILI